jgi:predicted nucleotidyltransferase
VHVEQVWSTDAKVKVLRTLAQPSFPQFETKALSRETGLSATGVRNALRDLVATGIVQPMPSGRTTRYALSGDHSMTESVLLAFRAEAERQGIQHLEPTLWNHLVAVVDRLSAKPGVAFVLLVGSLTRPPVYPDADADLLVGVRSKTSARGRQTRREIEDVQADVLGHPTHIIALDVQDFEAKVRAKDAFVTSALARNVVLYQAPDYVFPWARAPGPRRSWG